jgi:O-antigen/teichoic acid export membrane protein
MESWLRVLLAGWLTAQLGGNCISAGLAYLLAAAGALGSNRLLVASILPKVPWTGSLQEVRAWRSKLWTYSWPFAAWGTVTWLQQSSDRWALDWAADAAEVGTFAVVLQLGYSPIMLASGVAVTLVSPVLVQQAGDGLCPDRLAAVGRRVRRLATLTALLTLVGVFVASNSHDYIFETLVGADFRHKSHLLPWAVAAGGMFAIGQVLSLQVLSEAKSARLIMVKVVTAAFGVAANIAGAFLAGAHGVLVALLSFSAAYMIGVLFLLQRGSGERARTSSG